MKTFWIIFSFAVGFKKHIKIINTESDNRPGVQVCSLYIHVNVFIIYFTRIFAAWDQILSLLLVDNVRLTFTFTKVILKTSPHTCLWILFTAPLTVYISSPLHLYTHTWLWRTVRTPGLKCAGGVWTLSQDTLCLRSLPIYGWTS